MKLTVETFKNMIKILKADYGPNWRPDLDTNKENRFMFFTLCREVIPDEMAAEMIAVFRSKQLRGPCCVHDILNTYIENQFEETRSSDFVVDKLVEAIKVHTDNYDDYIYHNLIPILPCPNGVKEFYTRNRHKILYLARHCPEKTEEMQYYKVFEKDYKKQIFTEEKRAIIKKIDSNPLIDGNTHNQLEA